MSKVLAKFSSIVTSIVLPIDSCSTFRQLSSGNASSVDARPQKMQSNKSMSVPYWKVLNHLKDYLSKLSEKDFKNAVNKEFVQVLQKLQPSVYQFTTKPTEKKPVETKPTTTGYTFPNVSDVLSNIGINKNSAGNEPKKKGDVVPKWVSNPPMVSRVSRK